MRQSSWFSKKDVKKTGDYTALIGMTRCPKFKPYWILSETSEASEHKDLVISEENFRRKEKGRDNDLWSDWEVLFMFRISYPFKFQFGV